MLYTKCWIYLLRVHLLRCLLAFVLALCMIQGAVVQFMRPFQISRLFVRDRYRRCSCTDHNTGHAYHRCHTHQLGRYEMRQINGYISPNLCIDLRNGTISAVDGLFMHLSVRCVTWFACIFGLCRIRHFAFKLYKCARIIFMYLSVFALNAVAISFPRIRILANCHSSAAASSFVQFSLSHFFLCAVRVLCIYIVLTSHVCMSSLSSPFVLSLLPLVYIFI